ncbi:MAG TPA: hypothetical protein VF720_13145, partial [Candidatus Eisenbacteria bacterium]
MDSVTTKNHCSRAELTCCSDAMTQGVLDTPYFLYVLVAPSDSMWARDTGIAGVQFGLNYQGAHDPSGNPSLTIDVFGWTSCATLEFRTPTPSWPNPGSGIIITWDTTSVCQRKQVAVAGYFYMTAYQPGYFQLVPRPVDQQAKVVTCDAVERYVEMYNPPTAAFSNGATYSGWNPCSGPCPTTGVQ